MRRLLKLLLPMTLIMLLAMGLSSCGSDSPTGNNNNNNNSGDEFDENLAISTSQASASEAAGIVASMQSIAQGVGQPGRQDDYGWNAETMQWEWHYEWAQSDYTYIWDYVVQYLDGDGEPQQSSAGAAEILHSLTGTGHYESTQQGAEIIYDYIYTYNTQLTGMGSGTLLMVGSGSTDIDYVYNYGGIMQEYNYHVSWMTGGDGARAGVSMPEGSGCPTGSIVYDINPYEMEIVFDGDSGAPYTLYDSSGGVVSEGSGTQAVNCSP